MDIRSMTRGRIIAAAGLVAAAVLALVVTACGSGGFGGGAGRSVGGTVSGLIANNTLVLQDNGGDDKTITVNGPYTFHTGVKYGMPYNVTVLIQPTNPPQACTVSNATGNMGASNVTNVTVNCI